MERRNISAAAVQRAATISTKASAKLEGRVVSESFRRSEKVAQYLAKRKTVA